jgi:hypothetical protein
MSFITVAGQNAIAQNQQNNTVLTVERFVFALIPNIATEPSNRVESLPATNRIVHEQNVSFSAYDNENQVTYSCTLDSTVGDFDFNWVGLVSDQNVLIACQHITSGSVHKQQTLGMVTGNSITRNFALQYNGITQTTGITVPTEAWQFDIPAGQVLANQSTISRNYTLPDGNNAVSAGDITLTSNAIVTIHSNSNWVVL